MIIKNEDNKIITLNNSPINLTVGESGGLPVAGAVLWLDAADTSTITEATGVSVWADKSGNGYDLIQSNGGNQPTYVSGQYVEFDGGGLQHLYNDDILATSSQFTWFIVSSNNNGNDFMFDGKANQDCIFFADWGSQVKAYTGTRPRLTLELAVSHTRGEEHIWSSTVNGSNSEFFKNNVSVATTVNNTSLTVWDGLTLGGYYNRIDAVNFLDGYIREFIVYDNELTSDDRTLVYNYLSNKWGI